MTEEKTQGIFSVTGCVCTIAVFIFVLPMILFIIMNVVKISGAFNVNSWDPEQRELYESVFQITIPESVEWVRFREWHGFRDTIYRGELNATPEELAQLFPPERFPLEDLPAEDASFYVKECAIDFKDDIPHANCSYKFYPDPYKEYKQEIRWKIVAEFPSDENERIHVWFAYF